MFFCFSFLGYGQQLSGIITDAQNQPVSGASIVLKNSENKTISYLFSNDSGTFSFTDLQPGSYSITINALGYYRKTLTVNHTENADVFKITLRQSDEELPEIIIETKPPIIEKKDTIVFDVKSFSDGTENVLEDLLKKLPGIQVSQDGKISYGNQEIEKIMIEGDDFFEKGYRILSKNMPTHPLEEVELLKNYSNNKHLKGIENSHKVTLNLKLNEEAKREWFGNVSAGYGLASENRYAVRMNLMNFGKKDKYYFLTALNNLGSETTGDLHSLMYSSGESMVGDNAMAQNLLSLGGSTPSLKDERTNFNNAEVVSLNSIFTLSEGSKLKASLFFNTDEQNFYRDSYDYFSDGTTTFVNNENYFMRKKSLVAFGKVEHIHDFSAKTTLESTVRYHYQHQKNHSNILFNQDLLSESLQDHRYNLDVKSVLTSKLSENKVLILGTRYIQSHLPQEYWANQYIYQELFAMPADSIGQQSKNRLSFAGVEAKYMHKKVNGHLFQIRIGNEYRQDAIQTSFYLLDNQAQYTPSGFQNDLVFKNNKLFAELSYNYEWRNVRLTPVLYLNYLHQEAHQKGVSQKHQPFLIMPGLFAEWKINERNQIRWNYNYNRTTSEATDLYSGYIHSGFRSFDKGFENFVQFANHQTSLSYTLGNWSDRFFMNLDVGYAHSEEYFSYQSVLMPNYSLGVPIVLQNRSDWSLGQSLDYYLRPIRSNIKVRWGASFSEYQNFVNDSDIRNIQSRMYQYGFSLRSAFRKGLNYHFGNNWSTNEFRTETTHQYTNQIGFLNLTYRISKDLFVTFRNERYYFGNMPENQNTFFFSDLLAQYTIKDGFQVGFEFNNIFNNDTFASYSLTDISVSQVTYRLIPRYALLRFEKRF